jgi:hypothetical protein
MASVWLEGMDVLVFDFLSSCPDPAAWSSRARGFLPLRTCPRGGPVLRPGHAARMFLKLMGIRAVFCLGARRLTRRAVGDAHGLLAK